MNGARQLTRPRFISYGEGEEYAFEQLQGQAPAASNQHLKWLENTTRNIAESYSEIRNMHIGLLRDSSTASIESKLTDFGYESPAYQPAEQPAAPQPAPVVDTYTGCRAYNGNYALTSVDKKGRPYAKIDCTTKQQIG